jgi:hypothetical protein
MDNKREVSKAMRDLLLRIEEIPEEAIKRCGETFQSMQPKERLIGVVMDEWPKAVYTLYRQYGYEKQRNKVEVEDNLNLSAEERAALTAQHYKFHQAMDTLKEMFWHAVGVELSSHIPSMAVRKEWSIVDTSESDDVKKIIEAILGLKK